MCATLPGGGCDLLAECVGWMRCRCPAGMAEALYDCMLTFAYSLVAKRLCALLVTDKTSIILLCQAIMATGLSLLLGLVDWMGMIAGAGGVKVTAGTKSMRSASTLGYFNLLGRVYVHVHVILP